MDLQALTQPAWTKLDEALWDLPGVESSDPEAIREEALRVLPGESALELRQLLALTQAVQSAAPPDPAQVSTLLFGLGHLHAEIEALHRTRAEIESTYLGPTSVDPRALKGDQPEQIRRFLALRDRVFRQVADFTLKLLLGLLGILVVLLILGLI
jgi:hypothetical protein